MSDEVDRTVLPIRRPPFAGVADKTLGGSQPDWGLIGHVKPPAGAPNVLLVLIDDAGFGNPGTFGGPVDTPNYTRMAEAGLRYNRFHVTALCSPTATTMPWGSARSVSCPAGSPGTPRSSPRTARPSPGSSRRTATPPPRSASGT